MKLIHNRIIINKSIITRTEISSLPGKEKIWQITDSTERERQLELLREQPFYFYPPNRGYLSKGQLLKNLQTLKTTLECYKKRGVTKVKLEYT